VRFRFQTDARKKNRPATAPAFLVVLWQVRKSFGGHSDDRLAAAAYRFLVVRRVVFRLAAVLVERLAVFFPAAFLVVAICVGSS